MNPKTTKYLLWGGAGVAALAVGYFVLNAGGGSNAQAAAPAQSIGSTWQPLTYSSGTGTVPLDNGGLTGTGQSSISSLADLLPFAQQQESDNVALQNRSLDIQQMLGLRNIDANQQINQTNATMSGIASLSTLAAALSQSVVSAKATSAVTGQITGNGLNLNYTAEQITGHSNWNTPLQNISGGGITLANGTIVKG